MFVLVSSRRPVKLGIRYYVELSGGQWDTTAALDGATKFNTKAEADEKAASAPMDFRVEEVP